MLLICVETTSTHFVWFFNSWCSFVVSHSVMVWMNNWPLFFLMFWLIINFSNYHMCLACNSKLIFYKLCANKNRIRINKQAYRSLRFTFHKKIYFLWVATHLLWNKVINFVLNIKQSKSRKLISLDLHPYTCCDVHSSIFQIQTKTPFDSFEKENVTLYVFHQIQY